jgi:hypothetical protein
MSGVEHILGNVSFGPAPTRWEEQPTLRELYDQACAGLIRAECEIEELRAEVALAEAERIEMAKMLRSEREMHAACQNERDDARDLLERKWQAEDAPLIKMMQERDEARATIESLRDQLCADKCRDKSQADGGWANI